MAVESDVGRPGTVAVGGARTVETDIARPLVRVAGARTVETDLALDGRVVHHRFAAPSPTSQPGPCAPWVSVDECLIDPAAANSALDPDLLAEMIDVASEVLYQLSAQQFAGICTDTVRPLRRIYDTSDWPGWPGEYIDWRWQWGVHTCGRPPERAGGCGILSEITLGRYPIHEILEVRIDGQVIDPTWYRVDDYRWLVRIDQSGTGWPCCQQLDRDPFTDLDTFQVTFTWGQPPPQSGVVAARKLAIEMTKAASGSSCNLPERITNISTQGVSYTLLDPMNFLDKGRTGVYFVDLFLQTVNPAQLKRRSMVISPDIPKPVRRTATSPGS